MQFASTKFEWDLAGVGYAYAGDLQENCQIPAAFTVVSGRTGVEKEFKLKPRYVPQYLYLEEGYVPHDHDDGPDAGVDIYNSDDGFEIIIVF